MDGRDVRLHLRNQEHIERELNRIADALEALVKMNKDAQHSFVISDDTYVATTKLDKTYTEEENKK